MQPGRHCQSQETGSRGNAAPIRASLFELETVGGWVRRKVVPRGVNPELAMMQRPLQALPTCQWGGISLPRACTIATPIIQDLNA
jgi:hypothetical protein